MNIYAGNLSYSATENDLREEFAKFGDVSRVNIITDKFTGQSKGFGFIEMPDAGEAKDALETLDGSNLGGRDLKVNEAKPRENRSRNRR